VKAAAARYILTVSAAPHVARIADRIAASIVALAGQPDGRSVRVVRDNQIGAGRARSAIILAHPTPGGRRAANAAAKAATRLGA